MFGWFKAFWRRHVIQGAPPDLARCEFNCRVGDCSHGDWLACEKRIAEAQREIGAAHLLSQRAEAANGLNSAS